MWDMIFEPVPDEATIRADERAKTAELIATALEALDGDDNWGTMISQDRAVEIAREIGGVS